jgi:hypothetical protein
MRKVCTTKDLTRRIERVGRWASRIEVYQIDGAEFLRTVAPALPSRTLLYLDPPYYYVKGHVLVVGESRVGHRHACSGPRTAGSQSGARPALVNGTAGLVVFAGERPFAVLGFTIRGGRIAELDIFADPERLARLDFTELDA